MAISLPLQNGDVNSYVAHIKRALHIRCLSPGTFTTTFNNNTTLMVKTYQGQCGLAVTGIVEETTWDRLSTDMKAIQSLLKIHGFYTGSIDGIAGTGTFNAVLNFQNQTGNTADGKIGTASLRTLVTRGATAAISLPYNLPYLWNQSGAIFSDAGVTSGCSLACLTSIANICAPNSSTVFTVTEVKNCCDWDNVIGVNTWCLPAECTRDIDHSMYGHSHSASAIFKGVREHIAAGYPAIIKVANGSSKHFVVAFRYINDGTSASDFYVLDSAGSGIIRTLQEVQNALGRPTVESYLLTKAN